MLRSDSNSSTSNEAASSSSSDTDSTTSTFSPLATNDQSFTATMSGTGAEGATFDGTLEYDGKGNSKFTGKMGNDTMTMYRFESENITCSNDQCFALPNSTGTIDQSQYSYNEETFASYKTHAEYVGQTECPAGTCAQWKVTHDGQTANIFVASDNRVSRVSGERSGSTFSIDYNYQPVTITRPANVTAYPMS